MCADKPGRQIVLGCSANQPLDKTPEEQQQEEEEDEEKEEMEEKEEKEEEEKVQ